MESWELVAHQRSRGFLSSLLQFTCLLGVKYLMASGIRAMYTINKCLYLLMWKCIVTIQMTSYISKWRKMTCFIIVGESDGVFGNTT